MSQNIFQGFKPFFVGLLVIAVFVAVIVSVLGMDSPPVIGQWIVDHPNELEGEKINGFTIMAWNTGYSAEEGFLNCRLLMLQGYSREVAHMMHTNTSNGLEPDWGTVACDPSFIPYFSIIYSPQYAEMCGKYGLTTDSGGAIDGYDLDWWTETSEQSAALTGDYGVKILRWGEKEWLVNPKLWGFEP